jgi:hypothetical protein
MPCSSEKIAKKLRKVEMLMSRWFTIGPGPQLESGDKFGYLPDRFLRNHPSNVR